MPEPNLEEKLKKLTIRRDELLAAHRKLEEDRDNAKAAGETAKAAVAETELERVGDALASVQVAINFGIIVGMNEVAADLEESIRAQRAIGFSKAPEMLREVVDGLRIDGLVTTPSTIADPGPSAEPGGQGPVPDAPVSNNMDSPDPAPDGDPGPFTQARKIAAKTILYVDAAGRELIREGGSRSWRCSNRGNIRKGSFSIATGAIGDDGAFAIFPDEETGFDAIVTLLRSNSYDSLSLRNAIFRYAPPNENDSNGYAAFVEQQTGIPGGTVLSSLPVSQIRNIAKAIQKMEGWREGTERVVRPETNPPGGVSSAAGAALDWMAIAESEAALPANARSEWPDPGENPRILNYFKVGCSWFDPVGGDEVDWCAAFVNYCLVTAGYVGTNHPGARSFFWNKNQQFVRLTAPRFGAVAVRRNAPFTDEKWKTGSGHVGFVQSWTSTTVKLLGGNQSRTVRSSTYPLVKRNSAGKVTKEFVAFMMPVMN